MQVLILKETSPLIFQSLESVGEGKAEQHRIRGGHVWEVTSYGVSLHFCITLALIFLRFHSVVGRGEISYLFKVVV